MIGVGEFTLKVISLSTLSAAAPPAPPSMTTIVVSETPAAKIKTLPDLETPRISTTHLALLNEFGRKLRQTADRNQRLSELCKLMVGPQFHGRSAVALRIAREKPGEAPRTLC